VSADLAVTNATVVTMNTARTVLDGATVLVTGDRITAVGPPDDPPTDARRTIDAAGGIVVPGLVNAHSHLAMTMFRGLADDVDLERFLARVLPAEAAVLSDEAVAAGTALAVAECLRGGITTALDMYFFPEASAAVASYAGFDLRNGPVFVEAAGPDRRPFPARLAWAGELLGSTPPDRRWVAPHSTYLLDEDQLTAVGTLAAATGARVHVHACETLSELAAVRARHRRTPVEVLRDTGLLGSGTVLAHGVHLTDDDIALVASAGATVTHCPASNLKLGSGFAPIPELLAAGVPVALGTDGAASANDLDPWIAMRLAAYPLAARAGPGTMSAHDVLAMATNGGARAAGMTDRGSIEPGNQADLVVLDAASPSLTPTYDPVSTVAYAAARADVRWVVAGGRVVVDDRALVTIDVDATLDAVRRLAPSIRAATDAAGDAGTRTAR
jgi:5-methylthioadenosine/S-adenosylhomocysteine deaminase